MTERIRLRDLSAKQRRELGQKIELMYMREMKSSYQIAEELNMSNTSITWVLRGLRGVRMRGTGGVPLKSIRHNKSKVEQMKAEYLAKPLTKQYLKARDMLHKDMTLREAAEAVGLTVGQLAGCMYRERRRKRFGLTF